MLARPDYRALAERNDVLLAFCWSHVRRPFYELAAAGSTPIASEALKRIAGLYAIEKEIRGRSAEEPHAYLTEVITKIVNGHPNSRIDELLPWAYAAQQQAFCWSLSAVGARSTATTECLDLALLVDREDDRMGGRIDVEADDVFELLGELRVRRQLERADAMRRELVSLEDTLHRSQ
jgi:hypothetical protein